MRLVVIGGGAAGMMAAITAAENGHRVTVAERNARPARKVMITGKGRCNVTNRCAVPEFIAHVPQNGRFLYGALSRFGPEELICWFETRGVPLKTERGDRVFPVSDRAVDIVDCLTASAKRAGVQFVQGRVTALLSEAGVCTGVSLEDGRSIAADAAAVCTGGMSYPVTGSTGDGYALAKQAGHRIVPLRPSLVPLETAEYWPCRLQGLSLKNVTLTLTDTETGKKNRFGTGRNAVYALWCIRPPDSDRLRSHAGAGAGTVCAFCRSETRPDAGEAGCPSGEGAFGRAAAGSGACL